MRPGGLLGAIAVALLVSGAPCRASGEPEGSYVTSALREALGTTENILWRLEDDARGGVPAAQTEESVLRDLDRLEFVLAATPLRADGVRLRKILRPPDRSPDAPLRREPALALRAEILALQERIRQTAALAWEEPSPGFPDPGVRAARKGQLLRILGREEFRRTERRGGPTAWERFLDWLGGLLLSFRGERTGLAIAILLVILLGTLLAAAAIFLWRNRAALARLGRDRSPPAPPRIVTLPAPSFHEEEALRRERAGDWSGALRARFLGLLALLEREGVVARDRSQTNGEYLRAVASRADSPEMGRAMRAVKEEFDRVLYGAGACRREDYLAFRERADSVAARAGARP